MLLPQLADLFKYNHLSCIIIKQKNQDRDGHDSYKCNLMSILRPGFFEFAEQLALDRLHFQFADGPGGIEIFRADLLAVENSVAPEDAVIGSHIG